MTECRWTICIKEWTIPHLTACTYILRSKYQHLFLEEENQSHLDICAVYLLCFCCISSVFAHCGMTSCVSETYLWKLVCSDTVTALQPKHTSLNYADTWARHCNCTPESVGLSLGNSKNMTWSGKNTQLSFMSRFWMHVLCDFAQYSDFWHTNVQTDVQLSRHRGYAQQREKTSERVRERGGESDTFTPSCQIACGPLLIHSFLHATPPFWVPVFGFLTVKSKQEQEISPGMKDGEGREEQIRNRGCEKPWGGKVEPPGEIWPDWRRIVTPKLCIIHHHVDDVSWMSTSKAKQLISQKKLSSFLFFLTTVHLV